MFMTLRLILLLAIPSMLYSQPRLVVRGGNEVNFGKVFGGQKPKKTVIIANKGTKPLIINSATATCECAQISLQKTTIPPGKTTKLFLTLNTKNTSGPIQKSISIVSNDPASHTTILSLSALVEQLFAVEPPRLRFTVEETVSGTPKPLYVTNNSELPARILSVTDSVGVISFEFTRGMLQSKSQMMILAIGKPVGQIAREGEVIIKTSSKEQAEVVVPYFIEGSGP